MKQNDKKISTLKKIIETSPNSAYNDDAHFEIASTYLILNDNRNALSWFNQLISKFPNSSYLLKSIQKKGLIHYNSNEYQKALTALKKVVEDYPGTDESKESLLTIRNI